MPGVIREVEAVIPYEASTIVVEGPGEFVVSAEAAEAFTIAVHGGLITAEQGKLNAPLPGRKVDMAGEQEDPGSWYARAVFSSLQSESGRPSVTISTQNQTDLPELFWTGTKEERDQIRKAWTNPTITVTVTTRGDVGLPAVELKSSPEVVTRVRGTGEVRIFAEQYD